MRAASIALVVVLSCLLVAGALAASTPGAPRELVAATEAYKSNVAIGDSLGGKPASFEQISDAESFYQAAVAQARSAASENRGLAEAHRLLGLILCTGYRAVEVEQPEGGEGEKPRKVFVLSRGGADCEEGLAELRAAMGAAKGLLSYQLDYSRALLICGDAPAAEKQANASWKLSLQPTDRADCARVLVECARASDKTQEEIRWLREVVKYDPQDKAASARLAKLAPPAAPAAKPKRQNAIAWVEYENGMEQAEKQKKLVLAVFTATWCPTCKKLEKEVLQDRSVITASRQFVCVKIDIDQRVDLTSKHGVHLYPTTLVLDANGDEYLRLISFESAEQYAGELEGAQARAKETG